MAEQNTCPICLTKLKKINGIYECTVCGYKECDHVYEESRASFSQDNHSHTAYTTYSEGHDTYQSQQKNVTKTTSYSAGRTVQSTTTYPGEKKRKKKSPLGIMGTMFFVFYIITVIGVNLAKFIPDFLDSSSIISVIPELSIQSNYDIPEVNILYSSFEKGLAQTLEASDASYDYDFIDYLSLERTDTAKLKADLFYKDDILSFYFEEGASIDISMLSNLTSLYLYDISLSQLVLGSTDKLYDLTCIDSLETIASYIQPESLYSLDIMAPDSLELYSLERIADFQNISSFSLFAKAAAYCENLASCQNLSYLSLYIDGLQDISFIEDMYFLSWLDLGNGVYDSLEPLKCCPCLYYLSITNNRNIQDFSPIASLINLTNISLDYTNVEDLEFLSNITTLSTISLSGTKVTDLSPLNELPELISVYVYNCNLESLGTIDDSIIFGY